MSEPNTITSGDAIAWRRSLTASVDSAEYRLVGAGNFSIAAAIDGNDVVVNVNSATSAGYTAGHYKWFLVTITGTDRVIVDEGYLTVNPDPTALSELDTSTHASRVLAAIEQRIEGRILSDHENYSIDGRSLMRIPIEQLYSLRRRYQWEVHQQKVRRGEKRALKRVIHR